ncbi:hypothetical protein KJ785_04340 [Patescibacteria group bacterium]|nr:hypothetical protein [Patescibacteria group bacterium]
MDNLIAKLYQVNKTVFRTKDLSLIWQETNSNNLKAKMTYYVKQGDLIRLTRGIFVLNKKYSKRELAGSVYTPSYISFETVLRDEGIIFQHYDTIFVAGPFSKTTNVDDNKMVFRTLKKIVLYNSAGVMNKNGFSIATKERAFLDTIYLFPNYYFDNLKKINWDKVFELVKIYNNKELIKRVKKYYFYAK